MRLALYRRRAGRGVRGLGVVGYPSGYGDWLNPNWNYRFGGRGGMGVVGYPWTYPWYNRFNDGWAGISGLGQTDPYQAWVNSLPASCWAGGSPSSGSIICAAPASVLQAEAALPIHQPSPENFVNPAVISTANNPTFVTNAVSDAPSLTANMADLEGHLAQAVTSAMADANTIASLGDPTAYLNSVVAQYCASAGGLYVDSASNQCGQASSLVAKYAAELQTAINQRNQSNAAEIAAYSTGVGPNTPTWSQGYSASAVKSSIVTNPGAKTNKIATNAPGGSTNPAYQTPQSGNALQPYRYTYSGSTTTGGQTQLNAANNVNTLPTDTISNTGAGGAVQLTGQTSGTDNTWIWVAAIGAGLILLMMNTQEGA